MYCTHCGHQNQDNTNYCQTCGKALDNTSATDIDWENRCEQECAQGSKSLPSLLWGIIIILIGLWIIFTILSLTLFLFFALLPAIIVLVIIILGIKILTKK